MIDLQDNKASDLDLTAEEIRAPLESLSYLYILSQRHERIEGYRYLDEPVISSKPVISGKDAGIIVIIMEYRNADI